MTNLLQEIESASAATGYKCGLTIIQLSVATGIAISSIKPLLNELHASGKINVREGVNNKLIFPIHTKKSNA